MRRVIAIVAITVSALALGGCGDGGANPLGSGDTKLQKAFDWCDDDENLPDSTAGGDHDPMEDISVQDDGHSIIVDGVTVNVDGLVCILDRLGTSSALIEDMASTTSMMGRQKDEEHGLKYAWSYHPDNGMDMTIRD
jgi:hypothetical protein